MTDMGIMETDNRVKIAPLFRKHLRPKKDTPNLIAKLPPELRNRIYDLHFHDARSMRVQKTFGKRSVYMPAYNEWRVPPLLQTCKQIRNEAAPMFYKAHGFSISDGLTSNTLTRNIDKIRSVVESCGPKPFASFRINIRRGAWDNLGNILPLLELIRSTDFEPALQEYRPHDMSIVSYSSIFSMVSVLHSALQRVLEQAVAMGRRARDEKWTKEKLDGQFVVWKKKALSTHGQVRKRKKT